jgi:hypothetical protein
MSTDYEHIEVKNNEDEQRYEVKLDDQVAMLIYEREGNSIIFLHTEVPPALGVMESRMSWRILLWRMPGRISSLWFLCVHLLRRTCDTIQNICRC